MNQTKISVIMPSLNVSKYIKQCLQSVLNQTLEDIEIICVDGGSTDETLDIIQQYVKKDNRVKLIHSDIKSYGYQINLGIKEACGDYIGIIGKDYIRQIQKEKLCNNYIWVDKGYALKEKWLGVNVQSPKEMLNFQLDYVIIAVNDEKLMNEIKEELVELGIDNEKIIVMKPLLIDEFYS